MLFVSKDIFNCEATERISQSIMMFCILSFRTEMKIHLRLFARDGATRSCPRQKMSPSGSRPTYANDCRWDLSMVSLELSRIGNCRCRIPNGEVLCVEELSIHGTIIR